MDNELREIMGCTGLRVRRAARRITQVYDRALEPVGVTINQFGVLAHLRGAAAQKSNGLSIGALGERLATDPTTLNRTLKPLQQRGLVRNAADAADARVRLVQITEKGQRELAKAIPLWRKAQAEVHAALGPHSIRALNDLLDLSVAKIPAP